MKATQEEMMLHILNVQERVSSRMGKMDQRNRHQVSFHSSLLTDKMYQVCFSFVLFWVTAI